MVSRAGTCRPRLRRGDAGRIWTRRDPAGRGRTPAEPGPEKRGNQQAVWYSDAGTGTGSPDHRKRDRGAVAGAGDRRRGPGREHARRGRREDGDRGAPGRAPRRARRLSRVPRRPALRARRGDRRRRGRCRRGGPAARAGRSRERRDDARGAGARERGRRGDVLAAPAADGPGPRGRPHRFAVRDLRLERRGARLRARPRAAAWNDTVRGRRARPRPLPRCRLYRVELLGHARGVGSGPAGESRDAGGRASCSRHWSCARRRTGPSAAATP